jgi:hypothetical protein
MSHSEIQMVIQQLENGILPSQLNFCKTNFQEEIDWEKVKYNTFYKSFEYTASKFPPGFESIPGFDKVIEMNIPKCSPLEELGNIYRADDKFPRKI